MPRCIGKRLDVPSGCVCRRISNQLHPGRGQHFVVVHVIGPADESIEPRVHVDTRRVARRLNDVFLGIASTLEIVRGVRCAPRSVAQQTKRMVERLSIIGMATNEQIEIERDAGAFGVVAEPRIPIDLELRPASVEKRTLER